MNRSTRFLRPALLEYLEYDSSAVQFGVAAAATAAGSTLWRRQDKRIAFETLARVHRSGAPDTLSSHIERLFASAQEREREGEATGLWSFYREHIRRSASTADAASIVRDPAMLLGYRALVTKRATEHERGVLVIDYSYIFPLFAALFDIETIARRYHIVFEPSWRGTCTADILCYAQFDFPVFVETVEPRDTAFLESLKANFVPVPISANWWVDHRVVKPDPTVTRDLDVVMTAAWSSIKRHWRFFKVLSELRARGHRLKVALLGYPLDKNRAEIEDEARSYGVLDQLEIYERLPLADVVRVLSRAKLHLLWSRKEGANRAVIEALFADVPVIVRDGLSYGYRYPYINEQTGRFSTEQALGETILQMLSSRDRYRPREWAMHHMSPQRATDILAAHIRAHASNPGTNWIEPLCVKTVRLETQAYWNPDDEPRFVGDYAFLRAAIRPEFRAGRQN